MTTKRTPGQRSVTHKRAVFLTLLLLLLVTGSVFWIIHHAENRAEQFFIELLNRELSDGSEIVIDHFDLSLVPIGVTVRNIELLHRTPFGEKEPQKQLDLLRSLKIQEISLKRFRLWRYFRERHVEFDTIMIIGAETEVISGSQVESGSPEAAPAMPPLFVSEFQLLESDFSLIRKPDSEQASLTLDNVSLQLSGVALSDPEFTEFPQFEDIDLQVQKLEYYAQTGFYGLQADSLVFKSADNRFLFKNGRLIPVFSAREMATRVGHQIDRFEIGLSHFLMADFDLHAALHDGQLRASHVELNRPVVRIDRDKSHPRRERHGERLFPSLQFKNLSLPVHIDSVHAINGSLRYDELYTETGKSGFIQFGDIDLKVAPFQNISTEDSLFVRAETQFLNSAALNFNVDFSLAEDGAHVVSGTLGPMELNSINDPLEELISLRVNSGALDQLNFWFYADNRASAGSMIMIYRDLDISFLDDETAREQWSDRFKSFIANTFVIRSDNPSDDPLTSEIQYDRDPERSMFNYWLRSLATGLEGSVKR